MLLLEPDAQQEFVGIDTSDPNAVVIGLAPSAFNYDKLNQAFKILKENNGSLMAVHKGRLRLLDIAR